MVWCRPSYALFLREFYASRGSGAHWFELPRRPDAACDCPAIILALYWFPGVAQVDQRGRHEGGNMMRPFKTKRLGTTTSAAPNTSVPPVAAFSHWLSVEQIRKMQRMRRETVIKAMELGELPFEQRGRIRYARLADVLAWEERRLNHPQIFSTLEIDPYFADLL